MAHKTMTFTVACCLSAVITSSGWSDEKLYNDQLADGIYRVVPDGEGKTVLRTCGWNVDVGERVSDDLGVVSMVSISNHNDRYRMSVSDVGPFTTEGHFVLCVDGVCECFFSNSESDGTQKVHLNATIRGNENARRIGKKLKVRLARRKHPGHRLEVQWRSVKKQNKIGEPVMVEVSIKNVGKKPIQFMAGGQNRGARDNQFGFTAFSNSGSGPAVPDTGDPTNFGGLASFVTLNKGEVFRKQVDISKWFEFKAAGQYQITGMYELEINVQDSTKHPVWKDFATGRFFLTIVE